MMMYVILMVGFIFLVKGADLFVEGASSVAKLLRVPSVVIGLTIVAFGTSAPELAVSMTAALNGNNQLAVGNVIGSNIFNLLMVIGICGMISTMDIDKKILKGDYTFSVIVTILLFVLLAFDLEIGRWDAFILLAFFAYFLFRIIKSAMENRVEEVDELRIMTPVKSAIYISIGLAGIIIGGNLVVNSATKIALEFGISETLIGLTIVAIGTSLPELVTSIVASRKGENGLALGNVVGSNIFNVLFILGLPSVIVPIKADIISLYDIMCLIVFTLIVWWLAGNDQKISRKEGAVMVLLYATYMIYIIQR